LTLVLDARGLAVQRGKVRAPIEIDGRSAPIKFTVAMTGEQVGVRVTDACEVVHNLYPGLRNLEARVENVAALAHIKAAVVSPRLSAETRLSSRNASWKWFRRATPSKSEFFVGATRRRRP
jgi:hypothetical protein